MAKVLFQSTNARTFRATLVGYLHEIAQNHTVCLVADELDEETKNLLAKRHWFPGLVKVLSFESPFGGNIFKKQKRMHNLFQRTVHEFRPDIIVAPSDLWPAEMELFRLAKRIGATTLALQSGFKIAEQKKLLLWSNLMSAAKNMPRGLPFFVKMTFAKGKKVLGYALYHAVLPLSAGEKPFLGKSSFLFWHESSGKRDADYSAVFSKRDRGICVKDGVSPEKILVIGHPLEHESTKKFFQEVYFSREKEEELEKTVTVIWPEEKIGFRANDHVLIAKKEMQESRVKVIQYVSEKLSDWHIFIKPHPTEREAAEIKELLQPIGRNILVVNPLEPADQYIAKSAVILGMSLPSTALFTAQKQYPQKIILALNLCRELLGDSYKDFDGIEYIEEEERLIHILDSIQKGTYRKQTPAIQKFDFADAGNLIDCLYAKRIS